MQLLSASAYARTRGVSHVAVLKAIEDGRLRQSVTRPKPKTIRIDRELADREWDGSTDPAQQRDPPAAPAQPNLFGDVEKRVPSPVEDSAARGAFARARSVRELWNAKRAELDYRTRAGELAETKSIEARAFEVGRLLRSRLSPIGARLQARLAVTTDQATCKALVDEAITAALVEFERSMRGAKT